TKDQFWKLYEKLPRELKEALSAEETGGIISDACSRNDAEDRLGEISDLAGAVLIGLILPQEFPKKIEGLGIEGDTAERIAREISREVFYPVKPALEQLHNMEIIQKGKPAQESAAVPETAVSSPQAESLPRKDDAYREPIE
ncbi:MAG: hypothetical protein HYS60_01145, partial [Candidatus Wildermuthbacteria bacterium]|nr:hypothetical protein [Candidatus Wildermuthbacteria bacterium]